MDRVSPERTGHDRVPSPEGPQSAPGAHVTRFGGGSPPRAEHARRSSQPRAQVPELGWWGRTSERLWSHLKNPREPFILWHGGPRRLPAASASKFPRHTSFRKSRSTHAACKLRSALLQLTGWGGDSQPTAEPTRRCSQGKAACLGVHTASTRLRGSRRPLPRLHEAVNERRLMQDHCPQAPEGTPKL